MPAIRLLPAVRCWQDRESMSIDAVMPVTTTQDQPAHADIPAGVFTRQNLILAALLFLIALASLLALEIRFKISPIGVSNAPHFIYQAESFLQGRWDLDHVTARTVDVIT